MTNALKKFEFEGHPVRVELDPDGDPWWVLADVCAALDISNNRDVAGRLQEDEKDVGRIDTPGGPQKMLLINEAGLYRTIFRSTKEEAERMQRWVFHEVLPAIRQNGRYDATGTDDRRPVERETRYPDGRVVVERFEAPILPARSRPNLMVVPEIDLEELRGRFTRALRTAVREHWSLDHLESGQRGVFYQGLNSRLKNVVMGGTPRAEWTFENYRTAVDYLRAKHGLDLRWIFETEAS